MTQYLRRNMCHRDQVETHRGYAYEIARAYCPEDYLRATASRKDSAGTRLRLDEGEDDICANLRSDVCTDGLIANICTRGSASCRRRELFSLSNAEGVIPPVT